MARFDLSHMASVEDAIDEAFTKLDPADMLLIVSRVGDVPSIAFGIKRADIARSYENAARELMESNNDIEQHLWTLTHGGVEPRDEQMVACLAYAVARTFWLDENLTSEQVRGAHVGLKRNELSCEIFQLSDA